MTLHARCATQILQLCSTVFHYRPHSARKKDALVTPKEEQLLKKIKTLEEQIEAYAEKEKKWTENRRTKVYIVPFVSRDYFICVLKYVFRKSFSPPLPGGKTSSWTSTR